MLVIFIFLFHKLVVVMITIVSTVTVVKEVRRCFKVMVNVLEVFLMILTVMRGEWL